MVAAEEARLEAAKLFAFNKISEIQDQITVCHDTLEKIKSGNQPIHTDKTASAFDYDRANPVMDKTGSVVDEIAASLEALIGTTEDAAPIPEPKHPVMDSPTSKFTNLQFGRNYDPTNK